MILLPLKLTLPQSSVQSNALRIANLANNFKSQGNSIQLIGKHQIPGGSTSRKPSVEQCYLAKDDVSHAFGAILQLKA